MGFEPTPLSDLARRSNHCVTVDTTYMVSKGEIMKVARKKNVSNQCMKHNSFNGGTLAIQVKGATQTTATNQ